MPRKNLGLVLAAFGLAAALVSALADTVGIGRYPGFGSDQVLGTILGAVVLVLGLGVFLKLGDPFFSAPSARPFGQLAGRDSRPSKTRAILARVKKALVLVLLAAALALSGGLWLVQRGHGDARPSARPIVPSEPARSEPATRRLPDASTATTSTSCSTTSSVAAGSISRS